MIRLFLMIFGFYLYIGIYALLSCIDDALVTEESSVTDKENK